VAIGRLFLSVEGELVGNVEYHLHEETPAKWWGELVLTEYKRISEGAGYVLELEDSRSGSCMLKKRVNRAVSGVPPRYVYHFNGSGLLDGGKEQY
jgi:hypothetical protein